VKRIVTILIMAAVLLPLLGMTWIIAPCAEVQAQGANLLTNGGFEGVYISHENAGEVQVAPGWLPWHADGLTALPGITGGSTGSGVPTARPEYKAATVAVDRLRVWEGDKAQCLFSFYRTHYAGVYQQVSVVVGRAYQVRVRAQAWSSATDDPRKSEGEEYISLGLDPEGGSWYGSRAVVWTQWKWVGPTYVEYVSEPVIAQKPTMTLFLSGAHKWALKHGDIYMDDARMAEVSMPGDCPACPTPQPPVCPVYPTPVVCPVATPCPVCPAPVPGGTCPSLDEIRGVIHQECRFTVNWP
jgi:hypothetical protein